MSQWITKDGYETCIVATEHDLDEKETEIQLVKFHSGKYEHYHKRKTEFFYVIKGTGKVILNNEEKSLSPGSWVLVKPNTVHTFVNENEEPLEAIMFKTNSIPTDTFTE